MSSSLLRWIFADSSMLTTNCGRRAGRLPKPSEKNCMRCSALTAWGRHPAAQQNQKRAVARPKHRVIAPKKDGGGSYSRPAFNAATVNRLGFLDHGQLARGPEAEAHASAIRICRAGF